MPYKADPLKSLDEGYAEKTFAGHRWRRYGWKSGRPRTSWPVLASLSSRRPTRVKHSGPTQPPYPRIPYHQRYAGRPQASVPTCRQVWSGPVRGT